MSISRTFFVALLIFFWTSSGNGLFAQNAWESLPVFHNGRVMPLHTFAQQTVRDICGTTRPYIVWDDAVIAEFNQVIEFLQRANDVEHEETSDQFRFLAPSDGLLDGGFKREYSLFEIEKDVPQAPVDVSTKGLDRLQIDRLANRVRQLVTPEGRYFSTDEILLSWICEPQVWTYIPIFLVPETDYLEEMFGVSFENDARTSQYRVSLYQLEKSSRYKQRCADIQRRLELGQKTRNPVRFDQITERLQNQVRLFRELTFHPSRQRPERMLSLLSQSARMSHDQSLYASAFEMWSYLLSLGEASGRQVTDRASLTSASAVFHPTTQRWHVIADKLQLLMKAYQRTDEGGNEILPNPLMIEEQFEELMSLLDTNLAESAALMESIYPNVSYQTGNSTQKVDAAALLPRLQTNENQQNQEAVHRIIISYYYSVKKFRNEIEAAYLALYDNGLALRMLPIHSSLSLESIDAQGHLGVLPWASSQMILGSGEMFVKRFFDPELKVSSVLTLPTQPQEESNSTFDISEDDTDNTIADDTDNAVSDNSSGDPSTAVTEEKNVLPSTPASESANRSTQADQEATSDQSEEELLFLPFHMEGGIFPMDLGNQNTIIGSLRNNIRLFLVSYSSTGGEYGTSDFIFRVQQIQQACQQAAVRIEANRKSLINEEKDNEHLTKTAYPVTIRKLSAEYRYDRLNPFYWMWLCALLAVLCNGCAYIAAVTRSKSAVAQTITIHSIGRSGKKEETELQDYTNSLEEWLFFGSVVLLMGAIFIAFLGGVMRAAITGWAPITNMYETVVMTAFAAALIGIWYALHPLLHPALQLAWVYSQFPSFGTLREWFGAKREHQSVRTHKETAGEAAMREAAIEFGVPEGVTIGEHSPMPILTEEVIEAQQHVIIAQRKVFGQCLMSIPRLLLTLAVFYVIVLLANGEYAAEYGFIAAAENMFVTSDVIDVLVVAASVFLMVWLIPHFIVMLCLIPIILLRPSWIAAEKGIRSFEVAMIVEGAKHPSNVALSAHTTGLTHSEMSGVFHGEANFRKSKEISGAAWIKQARNALLDRKLFLMITAAVVFIVGLTANLNRVEFNPDIRPIAAVLRSNFWLTVHVIAIVISYAAAFIAWGMSLISLGYVIFGRFQRDTLQGQKMVIRLPATCQMFSPVIERLLRIALLLLVIGTVLGARWADYSWGRFWSWDPKEVWALITILFYAIVFHGRIARYYGTIGITVGALLASIAVIITWYGINFVFKGSVHSYGGGTDSNAMLFLGTFIAANVLWGALALLRYCAEVYGSDNEPQMT